MSKHTQGPWMIGGEGQIWAWARKLRPVWVADIICAKENDRALMSKAPELLECLKQLQQSDVGEEDWAKAKALIGELEG